MEMQADNNTGATMTGGTIQADSRIVPGDEALYFNRELSWLAFNQRVLAEARNEEYPLLERLRFLSISGSNLDEFMTVRVAGLAGQARRQIEEVSIDGRTPSQQLVSIREAYMALEASQQQIWRELRDLSRLGAFHTADCPDFVGAIQAGGLIYVVGDTDDLRIMAAQRMILARILQIIKGRERDGARQVSLFLDEYKYTISNVSLRALGTIRDRSCNLVLGYQNYADLEDCGNLPAKAVIGAAKGNTTLKFVFKLEDATTAKEFSLMAGEQSIMIETTGKILDDSGAEQGHWREASKAAVSVDMLTTNMPKPLSGQSSVSWVFGLGPAFLLSTMHLPAGPTPVVAPAKPLPTVASGTTAAQDLI